MTQTAERVWWKRKRVWVPLLLLAALLTCSGLLGSYLWADLRKHTMTRTRAIGEALRLYADKHDDGAMPAGPQWRQTLVDAQLLAGIYTTSPRAWRHKPESFCYVPGWTRKLVQEQRIDPKQHILVFENPASTHADKLFVFTWDGAVRELPRDELLQRLANTRTGDGTPVTWEGMK